LEAGVARPPGVAGGDTRETRVRRDAGIAGDETEVVGPPRDDAWPPGVARDARRLKAGDSARIAGDEAGVAGAHAGQARVPRKAGLREAAGIARADPRQPRVSRHAGIAGDETGDSSRIAGDDPGDAGPTGANPGHARVARIARKARSREPAGIPRELSARLREVEQGDGDQRQADSSQAGDAMPRSAEGSHGQLVSSR
jgi:hypothetical protein